jgi:hypothetical protein
MISSGQLSWKWWLGLALFWVCLRLPNLGGEMGLQMDAASVGVAWFIHESWENEPAERWFAPVDQRHQWEELETGRLKPYLHIPPLGLWPLGIWIQCFGMEPTSLRSAGIFFSLLLLLSCILWMRGFVGDHLAFGALLLLALSPHSMHYSRNVDPMVTNAYGLPLMAWGYWRYLNHPTTKKLWQWLGLSSIAMLSYWVSFGVFGACGIYHLWKSRPLKGLHVIPSLLTPIVVAILIWLYNVVASGGWDVFMADWEYTLQTRTQHGYVPWFDFLKREVLRWLRNEGLVLILGSSMAIVMAIKQGHREMLFVCCCLIGALLFPIWVKRATMVHEYFTIWKMPLLALLCSWMLQQVWRKQRWVVGLCAVLILAQSVWVGTNRIVHYDRDYLLARRAGEAYRSWTQLNGTKPVLVTDIRDNLHSLQYSSDADVLLIVDDEATLKKAIEIYEQSGRKEGLVFMTIGANEVLEIIPDLRDYPKDKLTGEFGLEKTKKKWEMIISGTEHRTLNGFEFYEL